MRYYLLFSLLVLSGFVVPAAIGAAGVCAGWRQLAPWAAKQAPRSRARLLCAVRAFPSLIGCASALVIASTFLRYEPRQTSEEPGAILVVLATVAAALAAVILTRAFRSALSASVVARLAAHCRQRHQDGASISIVDTAYPVATVAGIWRPRLLLSSRILHECTPDEIELIVAHERAHMRGGDNITRASMACLPDPLAVLATGRELEFAWTLAIEEVADNEAAGSTDARRATLAAALIRVAGMADEKVPSWMPALSFYQGIHLQQRVRSLLSPPVHIGGPEPPVQQALFAVVALILSVSAFGAETLHQVMEWIVRSAP